MARLCMGVHSLGRVSKHGLSAEIRNSWHSRDRECRHARRRGCNADPRLEALMTGRTPPKLATFLLKQLGCAPDTDAIIGDLTEGYGCGQTTGWYWKQVLSAIAAGAFNDIRSHKLLALRAIVAGILVKALLEALYAWILVAGPPMVGPWVPVRWWSSAVFLRLYEMALTFPYFGVNGFVVGWTMTRLYSRRRAILWTYVLLLSPAMSSSMLFYDLDIFHALTAFAVTVAGVLFGGRYAAGRHSRQRVAL